MLLRLVRFLMWGLLPSEAGVVVEFTVLTVLLTVACIAAFWLFDFLFPKRSHEVMVFEKDSSYARLARMANAALRDQTDIRNLRTLRIFVDKDWISVPREQQVAIASMGRDFKVEGRITPLGVALVVSSGTTRLRYDHFEKIVCEHAK